MIQKWLKKVPIIYFVLCSSFFALLFLFILFSSHILNPTSIHKVTTSKYQNSITYQVLLNNNPFISNTSLGMNQSYITSMVNSISVQFKENTSFHTSSDVSYNYTIYAKLSSIYHNDDGSDSEIWSQIYPLFSKDNQVLAGNRLSIDETVVIPYWDYQSIVDNFKNTYHLKVDPTLDVVMDIQYQYGDERRNNTLKLSIPMDQEVFKISTDYKKKGSIVESQKMSNMTVSYGLVMFALIIVGIFLIVSIGLLLMKLIRLYSMTEYERIKSKIKKDYGSIIVDIDNTINFDDFTIFDIKTIGELVDLEEELRIPILFYEKSKAKICYFVIIKEHYMYRYTLKDSSQEII